MSTDWTKTESETIDWLRPVMAFMVICLHVQLFYVDEHWSMDNGFFSIFVIYLCRTVCPVAVPSFFFISGYLFFKGMKEWNGDIWKQKMIKRIKTLLIPFVLWNLIALIAYPITRYVGSILKGIPSESLIEVIQDRGFLRLFWATTLFEGSVGQPMNTPLWFVRDLMVVLVFTPAIHWLIRKTGLIVISVLGLLFLVDIWIPVPGFGVKATFFFAWGALYSIQGRTFIESFIKVKTPLTVLFLVGLASIPFIWDIDRQAFFLAVRFFIIIELFFFFNLAFDLMKKGRIRVNKRLSSGSFFVYCSHMVLIASGVMWIVMLPSTDSGIIRTLLFIAGAVSIYVICQLIYLLLDSFFPSVSGALTGGRNNK